MSEIVKWREHPEYVSYLMDFIPGHSTADIIQAFYEVFNIRLTSYQVKNFCHYFGVRQGINSGRFKKGHQPDNKGKKMSPEVYAKAAPTMFKKGQVPVNHRPVGSERVNVDGYIEIKVAEPNRWRLKQRVVYEKFHNVVLTKGEVIVFLDGNKLNCEPDNLKKISRSALARYNQDHLGSSDRDLNHIGIQIAQVKALAGERKKKRK